MRRVQIQFPDEMSAALHERAKAVGRPVSAIVRDYVSNGLAEEERQLRWDRALSAVGKYNSGLGDVARNHDKYLDEEW